MITAALIESLNPSILAGSDYAKRKALLSLCFVINGLAPLITVALIGSLNPSILDGSDYAKRKAWFSLCVVINGLGR